MNNVIIYEGEKGPVFVGTVQKLLLDYFIEDEKTAFIGCVGFSADDLWLIVYNHIVLARDPLKTYSGPAKIYVKKFVDIEIRVL